MISIEIQTNIDKTKEQLEKFRELIGEKMASALQAITTEVRNLAQILTPYVTGKLFKGWHKVVYSKGSPPNEWIGDVYNKVPYLKKVDLGSPPGEWVPIGPLKQWCKVVLGEENLAYPVRWKIFRQGTQGKFILKQLENEMTPEIKAIFETILEDVKGEWEKIK